MRELHRTRGHKEAEKLFRDLASLVKKSRGGEEITLHHLSATHGNITELLRQVGGFEEILERYEW
jgi:hypothetical protein